MNNTKPMIKKKSFFVFTTILLSLILVSLFFMGMSTPTNHVPLGVSGTFPKDEINIDIEKPNSWQSKETKIAIIVSPMDSVKKVEARISDKGSWVDITDDMYIEISENTTIYIQVTDKNGTIHTKNRYLEIFDRTAPILKARISKTTLQIEVDDDLSGVKAVYIDGEMFNNFNNGTLDVKVKDVTTSKYDKISIYATDNVGNRSSTIELNNPLFNDESKDTSLNKQASTSESSESSGSASTTSSTSGNAETTQNTTGSANGKDNTASQSSSSSSSSLASEKNSASSDSNSTEKNSSGSGDGESPLFGTFEDTNKQFMSIVTKDGQVFYMIIDHDRESENVYLLTEVTNSDLESFNTEEPSEDENGEFFDEQSTEPEKEEKPTIDDSYTDDKTKEKTEDKNNEENNKTEEEFGSYETKEEEKPQKSSGFFFIILIAVIVIGGGYYVKIYKPKKELEDADNLDDYNFIEEGETPDEFSIDEELDSFSDEDIDDNQPFVDDDMNYDKEENTGFAEDEFSFDNNEYEE